MEWYYSKKLIKKQNKYIWKSRIDDWIKAWFNKFFW